MQIEVTWEVKPKSGITFIDISDLNCKNKKEWYTLDKKEQEKRINEALMVYDQASLIPLVTEW